MMDASRLRDRHNVAANSPIAADKRIYALALFLCAHTLLSVDRSIMAILLEPIKAEFHLSDTQLGLLTGLAFAFFFGIAGLPLGRLVDHFNRRNLLVVSVGTFSLMTALAGTVTSFTQLLLARLIVGAGEAGGSPAMLSMIADFYPARKRASAVAIYYTGGPLGGFLIFLTGGWIAMHYGWRAVLLSAGIPGLVLALVLFTIREPKRMVENGAGEVLAAPPFREALAIMWSRHSLRHLLSTSVITSAATAGLLPFIVSYLVRSHGITLGQAGMSMSVAYGVVGTIATILGGVIVDRLARRDERWRAWFCTIACLLTFPAVALMTLAPTLPLALVGLACWTSCSMATYGPLMALLQSLVSPRMRGTVSSMFYFLAYFLGMSLGPQLVGVLSDLLGVSKGGGGLRYAMLIASTLYLWASLHFFLAARTLRVELIQAQAETI